jgi:hypothetical protein
LITPRSNLKTSLRLNGYYAYKYTTITDGLELSNVRFLYKNGIIFDASNHGTHSDIELEKIVHDNIDKYMDKYRKDANYWKVVSISNSSITIEGWNSSLSPKNQDTIIEKGIILNDTTFRITSLNDRKGQLIKSVSNIYEFKKFSPKPDSTNKFIK